MAFEGTASAGAVVGLLVAAGRGRRFDPTGARSKLEATIDGTMVAVRTAQALLAGCDRVIAAVRPDSASLSQALARAGCEIAPVSGEEGMGNSIACGARAALRHADLRVLLVQPADMPWLAGASVRQVAHAVAGEGQLIVVPTFKGRNGHPVRFDRSLVPALAQLSGEGGARRLVLRYPPLRIPLDDAGVVRDLDTPADFGPSHGDA
jgi:molybdenum cofactor cytidylyltransferase